MSLESSQQQFPERKIPDNTKRVRENLESLSGVELEKRQKALSFYVEHIPATSTAQKEELDRVNQLLKEHEGPALH